MSLPACCVPGWPRRAFELHRVAFWIGQVDRRSFSLRAVSGRYVAGRDAYGVEVKPDRRFVERFDTQAEVVQISPFAARRGPAGTTERTVDRDEIDQRASRAQLHKADILAPTLDCAAEDVA